MTNNATFIRIFKSAPDDDYVQKREEAIKEIADKIRKKRNVNDIMQIADELAAAMVPKAVMGEAIASQVQAALEKQSQAFVRDGEQYVCAGRDNGGLGVAGYECKSTGDGNGKGGAGSGGIENRDASLPEPPAERFIELADDLFQRQQRPDDAGAGWPGDDVFEYPPGGFAAGNRRDGEYGASDS